MILILNTFSDHALYLYQMSRKYLKKGFRVIEGLDFQYSKFSKGHNSVKKCRYNNGPCCVHHIF